MKTIDATTRTVITLCALLVACGDSENPQPICNNDDGVGRQRSGLSQLNGPGVNGAYINGPGVNGAGYNAPGVNGAGYNAPGVNGGGYNSGMIQGSGLNGLGPNGQRYQASSLNGVTLNGLSLNGAWVNGNKLQGASLNGNKLQGSSLNGNKLQGSSLNGNRLQGGSLNGSRFQGSSLNGYNFQGRSLNGVWHNRVALNGTRLEVTFGGKLLSNAQLVGATLQGVRRDGSPMELKIAAVETDENDSELTYYSLQHEGINICGDNGKGLFLRGIWDDSGERHDNQGVGDERIDVSYACTTGVLTKCIRWGYKPWKVGQQLHQACTRMARADYCGDGVPHTNDGTLIDLYDGEIQKPEMNEDDGFIYEAGWNKDGAVCVNKTRYFDVDDAGQLFLPTCWTSLPRCNDAAEATQLGAVIHNASREMTRNICR